MRFPNKTLLKLFIGLLAPPLVGGLVGFFVGIPSLDTPAVGRDGLVIGTVLFGTIFSVPIAAIWVLADIPRSRLVAVSSTLGVVLVWLAILFGIWTIL